MLLCTAPTHYSAVSAFDDLAQKQIILPYSSSQMPLMFLQHSLCPSTCPLVYTVAPHTESSWHFMVLLTTHFISHHVLWKWMYVQDNTEDLYQNQNNFFFPYLSLSLRFQIFMLILGCYWALRQHFQKYVINLFYAQELMQSPSFKKMKLTPKFMTNCIPSLLLELNSVLTHNWVFQKIKLNLNQNLNFQI